MMTEKKQAKIQRDIEAMGFTAFVHDDRTVYVSAEEGDGAADYWGEFGDPLSIAPELDAYAKKLDMYWEWQNPGVIGLWGL